MVVYSLPFQHFFFLFFLFFPLLTLTMEDLIKYWNRLTLSQRRSRFLSQQKLSSKEFLIAAKFLTKRVLNIDAIARTFNPLWCCRNGFRVHNLGDHKFLLSLKVKMMWI